MEQILPYTPQVAEATKHIYDRVSTIIPDVEWPIHAPYIALINELKTEQNAILLAHNSVSYTHLTLPTILRV